MISKIIPYAALAIWLVLSGCAPGNSYKKMSAEWDQREREYAERIAAQRHVFPDYPKVGTTYLHFDPQHKFQVEYYESRSRTWLWYGGNDVALPADWELRFQITSEDGTPLTGNFRNRICWRYGQNTYNPATKQSGGQFDCTLLVNSLNLTVGALAGDPFDLASGNVPYVRQKCDAPDEFQIQADHALISSPKDCKIQSTPTSETQENTPQRCIRIRHKTFCIPVS